MHFHEILEIKKNIKNKKIKELKSELETISFVYKEASPLDKSRLMKKIINDFLNSTTQEKKILLNNLAKKNKDFLPLAFLGLRDKKTVVKSSISVFKKWHKKMDASKRKLFEDEIKKAIKKFPDLEKNK